MEALNNYLGRKCSDSITGFSGICTGFCVFISGGNLVLLTPGCKNDGTFIQAQWFDQKRVKICKGDPIVLDNQTTPGKPTPTF